MTSSSMRSRQSHTASQSSSFPGYSSRLVALCGGRGEAWLGTQQALPSPSPSLHVSPAIPSSPADRSLLGPLTCTTTSVACVRCQPSTFRKGPRPGPGHLCNRWCLSPQVADKSAELAAKSDEAERLAMELEATKKKLQTTQRTLLLSFSVAGVVDARSFLGGLPTATDTSTCTPCMGMHTGSLMYGRVAGSRQRGGGFPA